MLSLLRYARSVLLTALLLAMSVPATAQQPHRPSGPKYMAVVAPTVGWLSNKARFPVPVGRNADGSLAYEQYELQGSGMGAGVTLIGRYKQWTATNVLFGFPQVNHARLLGGVTYVQGSVPTGTFLEPSLGLGLVGVFNRASWNHFTDTRIDDLGGKTLQGNARLSWIYVQTSALTAFPRLGLKMDLPIQHWYVRPFGSYRLSWRRVRARSGGGEVNLWDYDPTIGRVVGESPVDTVKIRSFDTTSSKTDGTKAVGVDYLVDFHYFIQQRGEVSYNVDKHLWTARLMASLLFTMQFGVTAYFEYSQKETVSNTFFLVGPAYVFFPDGFKRRVERRRKARGRLLLERHGNR